jgi:hypothetical protein
MRYMDLRAYGTLLEGGTDLVGLLRYEGERDSQGYDPIFEESEYEGDGTLYMQGRGGGMLRVMIDGTSENVFEEISRIDPTDKSEVTALCDRYGLWRPVRPKKGDPTAKLESLEFQRRHIHLMEVLQLAAEEDWPSLESVAAKRLNRPQNDPAGPDALDFRRVPGSKEPRLIMVTRDLFTFAMLQVCAAISDGQKIKRCQNCTAHFAVGPNTGRKLDGIFCSAKCRVAAHRAKG